MVAGVFAAGMRHLRGKSTIVLTRPEEGDAEVPCIPDKYEIQEVISNGGLREEAVITVITEQALRTGEIVSFNGAKHKVHLSEPSIARGDNVGWSVKLILIRGR